MSAKTPTVWLMRDFGSETGWRSELEHSGTPLVRLHVDSAAWFEWLEEDSTTSFCYPLSDRRCGYIVGFMTIRKERRDRGGRYWVAYRRCQGQLRKVYLGTSLRLTGEHLERLAQRFLAASQSSEPLEERTTEIPKRKGGDKSSVR